jgi:hypothetical protein
MFEGGLTWEMTSHMSLTYHLMVGNFGDGTARLGAVSNAGWLSAQAIIFIYEFASRASYVLEHTLGSNTGLGAQDSHSITPDRSMTARLLGGH